MDSPYSTVIPQSLKRDSLELLGVSCAGIGTSITVPKLKVCFDTAQGLPHAFHMKHYLITHGHMDHAGGIPYILSQKSMTNQGPGTFYMPPYMIEPLTKIVETWSSMEGYKCPYHFLPVEDGQTYELDNQHFFKIFPTHHRVKSNGYTIFQQKKKLKKEFQKLSQAQVAQLAKSGKVVSEVVSTPYVSFTGDTTIDFLDTCPWLADCENLIMEVTYGGPKKSIADAKQWGHIHLDELIPRLPELRCKNIILIHQSARFGENEFQNYLQGALRPEDQERVVLFPRS